MAKLRATGRRLDWRLFFLSIATVGMAAVVGFGFVIKGGQRFWTLSLLFLVAALVAVMTVRATVRDWKASGENGDGLRGR